MIYSFKPATNKKGLSKLTFKDFKKVDVKDKSYSIYRFEFKVKAQVKGNDKIINVQTTTNYKHDNNLGITLVNSGVSISVLKPTFEELKSKLDCLNDKTFTAVVSHDSKYWQIDHLTIKPLVLIKTKG
jgi:hypothetical protein